MKFNLTLLAQRYKPFVMVLLLLTLFKAQAFSQSTSLETIADAGVYRFDPVYGGTLNYGNSPDLILKNDGRRVFVKFDVSSINLQSAGQVLLRLYCRSIDDATKNTVINALSVNDNSWSESSITYNNSPAVFRTIASQPITAAAAYYDWDITDYIRTLNPTDTITIAFSSNIEDLNTVYFNSKETQGDKPQLIVKNGIQTFTATDDAQIYQAGPTNNYGATNDLLVKTQTNLTRYSYVKFDLSNYHINNLGRAVVRLYCRTKYDSAINNVIQAWAVNDNNWTEGTLNYSNQPVRSKVIGSATITNTGQYYDWDITDHIRSLNLANNSNKIVSIAFSDVVATNNTITFNSKEAGSSTQPLLTLHSASYSTIPQDDSQVYEAAPENNYGTSPDLLVKITTGTLSRYTYLKFDISNYQVNNLGKAIVRLYCRNKANLTINNIINALAVADTTWNETSLKYSSKPVTGQVIATNTITNIGKYYDFDITSYVNSLNLASGNIRYISIAFSDDFVSDNTVTFDSKESGSGNAPQLVFTAKTAVFYVDSQNGNDANDGTSELKAWKSLIKVNSQNYYPGSKILIKRGSIFSGQLMPQGSGIEGYPNVIDTYGDAASPKPIINGNGIEFGVVKLFNQSYWEINNLEITNNATLADKERRGVEINASNSGLIEHIYLKDLIIHDIKGSFDEESDASNKRSGGIYISVKDDSVIPTRYNDILIEGCQIYNCRNIGIVTNNEADGGSYPRTNTWEQRKITNLMVRNNTIHDILKNAMIIRLAEGGVIERNTCYNTATGTTGNTMFSRSCINTVFQYNEGYLNKSIGAYDGSMYDADLSSPGVVFQYSYSHENMDGMLWICTSPADTGIVARYNISRNDKGPLIYFAFETKGVNIYNNTFYIPETLNPVIIGENYRTSHTYTFQNNIVYNANASTTRGYFDFAQSPRVFVNSQGQTVTTTQTRTITDNIFYRTSHPSQINFNVNSQSDPLFVNPGTTASVTYGLANVGGYKLKTSSPALSTGVVIANNGGKDYFGMPVSATAQPNIGFYNGPATTSSAIDSDFHIYLLTGQSNMSGRGLLSGSTYVPNPRIKMLNNAGQWVTATHPLHGQVEQGTGVGPGIAFAVKMLENADPNITIGLVPTAVGGQNIGAFSPGAINSVTNLSIYDESVWRVQLARTYGVLKGILYHQGEADSWQPSVWAYRLKDLVANFRNVFGDSKLPFIFGEMGRFPSMPNKYINILNVMPAAKRNIPYADFVTSQGLTSLASEVSNPTHFDTPSANTLGIRYALLMKQLQSDLSALQTTTMAANVNTGSKNIKLVDEVTAIKSPVRIFPNPTKGMVFVNLANDKAQPVVVSVYDLLGKKITTLFFSANEEIKFNTLGFNDGIYLLEVRNQHTKSLLSRTKFIKN